MMVNESLPAIKKNEKDPIQKQQRSSSLITPLNLSAVPIVESSQSVRAAIPRKKVHKGSETARILVKHDSEHSRVKVDHRTIGKLEGGAPYSAAQVIQSRSNDLSDFEQTEILSYEQIYYFSLLTYKMRKKTSINEGFDDDRGDYKVIIHDHFAYRYEVLGTLGRGSFGQVIKCLDHATNTEVAVKVIRNKKRFQKQALVEVDVLKQLRNHDPNDNANVIHIKEHFTFRNHLCITFKLMSVNLYEYVKHNNFQGINLGLIRRFAIQILRSLKYMEKQQIIHCDLKPENILLENLNKSGLRIIDFGSSCYTEKQIYTYIQSRFYRSPEVILGLPYGLPIDMWSFGCILAELFTGFPLFPGENELEQLACIMEVFGPPASELVDISGRRTMFFDSDGGPRIVANSRGRIRKPGSKNLKNVLKCNDELFLNFLRRILCWDPEKRLTPREALKHEWIVAATSIPPRRPSQPNLKVNEIAEAQCVKKQATPPVNSLKSTRRRQPNTESKRALNISVYNSQSRKIINLAKNPRSLARFRPKPPPMKTLKERPQYLKPLLRGVLGVNEQ